MKHAQYHYNPGRDIVFRGEFIPVRTCACRLRATLASGPHLESICCSCHQISAACARMMEPLPFPLPLTTVLALRAGSAVQGPLTLTSAAHTPDHHLYLY